jgi:histidyl-tRNA synthetase
MQVKDGLNRLKIPFRVNERLVRGLDYYVRTAFEMVSPHLGAQNTVAAGGRYDGLVESLGGPSIPGIGFALGIERAVALLDKSTLAPPKPDLFLAALGHEAKAMAGEAIYRLRQNGIRVETDYEESSLRSQMRRADKLGARYVLILGEDEIKKGRAILRDMATKDQKMISLPAWLESLIRLIKRSEDS